MSSLEEIRAERIKKLERLQAQGIDPYPITTNPTAPIAEVVHNFETFAEEKSVVLAGRVKGIRAHGGALFFDLVDGSYNTETGTIPAVEAFDVKIQGYLKRDSIGEEVFALFEETVDMGDFVEITGKLFITKREEKTLEVESWRMLAKSLRPLPDKWHGLQDVEERFRKRYLDSLMSGEVRRRFVIRSRVISEMRNFLESAGFLEMETPVLQPLYGGASAAPFKTHHNALDAEFYLRISDELYLKRMLIGGFPKVYEIAKDFRNEGIDVTHNPEFTMLEFYEAWSDSPKQQVFVEKLVQHLVKKLYGGSTFTLNGVEIDVSKSFTRIAYSDLLKRYALITDPENASRDEVVLKANQLGVDVAPADSKEKILDNIYKKACRPKLIQPTFIVDYPADYLPLAKRSVKNPAIAEVFQLIIGGFELVKAFSELNNPIDQFERLTAQDKQRAGGDSEAQTLDMDFIEAMEYGMPPAGGVGIGIDRLVMALTDTHNIREIVYFPTLRPEKDEKTEEKSEK